MQVLPIVYHTFMEVSSLLHRKPLLEGGLVVDELANAVYQYRIFNGRNTPHLHGMPFVLADDSIDRVAISVQPNGAGQNSPVGEKFRLYPQGNLLVFFFYGAPLLSKYEQMF